jgi:hypothetical protein
MAEQAGSQQTGRAGKAEIAGRHSTQAGRAEQPGRAELAGRTQQTSRQGAINADKAGKHGR